MKKSVIYLFLCFSLLSFLSACGKKEEKEASSTLSKEFILEKMKSEEGAEVLGPFLFNEVISAAKVSSLSHDSTGSSLGYILTEGDLEQFIKLFQEEDIMGFEISKETYQSNMKNAISGFIIEFMDSQDQFQEGVTRISCVTNVGKYYVNTLDKQSGSKAFRITLPDKVVDFLNEKSKENYAEKSGNPGWFDKAFKK